MAKSNDRGAVTRIWRYVLAADNGMAPCIDDAMLTLCCCKPGIRKSAKIGDWVIGFFPKSRPGYIAWVGQVAESLLMGEYERQFSGRRDAIYRIAGHTEHGAEILRPLRDDYHVKSVTSDTGGRNALVFRPFWYWGGRGIAAPNDIADLAYYFIGQSAKDSTPDKVTRLETWVRSVAEPGVHSEPRSISRT